MAEAAPPRQQPHRDIVVIGASAGGVEALETIAAGLPHDLVATLYVVLHLPEGAMSVLADILDRAGPLPARAARAEEPVRAGTIVVAPPDHHLVLDPGRSRLVRGPRINGHRPSVDVLFHSAARSHGSRVVGVVLSGALSDGALGLRAIKRRGGAVVTQADPVHRGMPESAMASVAVDAVVPLRAIAPTLTMLTERREKMTADGQSLQETGLEAGFDIGQLEGVPGNPSVLRCPECGGALWELEDAGLQGYACHVGHTFSAQSLLEEQGGAVERALWSSVRILREQSALLRRLAKRMDMRGNARSASHFLQRADEADAHAGAIRRVLERPEAVESEASAGRAA